jgi:Ca2+-binding EF-hand superfamily protein
MVYRLICATIGVVAVSLVGNSQAAGSEQESFAQEELAEAFRGFDLNGDGALTLSEFSKSSHSEGEDRDNLEIAFRAFDRDRSDSLDEDEFSALIRIGEAGSEEAARQTTFAFMDANGDGLINHAELKQAMEQTGQAVSDGEISEGIEAADRDGDEMISFEEFAAVS